MATAIHKEAVVGPDGKIEISAPELPPGQKVQLILIERIAPYHSLLSQVWQGARRGDWTLLTSELTLMEALFGPLKAANAKLEAEYRSLLTGVSDVTSVPSHHTHP